MLQEVLLDGRPALTAGHLSAHFERPLRAALTNILETRPIAETLSESGRGDIIETLKSAAHPVAFASGVEVLPPFHLDLESPSFQQQRLREMQRGMAEREQAGQVEHFQRAAELLKQFQVLRQAAPELSAGQVLQQVNPADRGSVLQTLLLASARQDRATDLWAVAGPFLVRVDARTSPPKTVLISLPSTLGPLRSVQGARVDDERVLLVGARSGFMVVRPDAPDSPTLYADPQITSQLGFSRVVYWAETKTFVACHGDAGIVRWALGDTNSPRHTLRSETLRNFYPSSATTGPRNVQVLSGGRTVFIFGSKLLGMNGEEDTFALPTSPTTPHSEIVALVPDDLRMLVVHEDGTVCGLDRTTLYVVCKQQAGTRVRAAGALPWLGSTRLLLASDDGAIQCTGLEDPLVTQYASAHRGVRGVSGSADLVAAISADRQRLILWNTWNGREPVAEIFLAGLTRHRVADVCFG
jgi:hypothetical protein